MAKTCNGKNRESRGVGVGVLFKYKLIVKEHVDLDVFNGDIEFYYI